MGLCIYHDARHSTRILGTIELTLCLPIQHRLQVFKLYSIACMTYSSGKDKIIKSVRAILRSELYSQLVYQPLLHTYLSPFLQARQASLLHSDDEVMLPASFTVRGTINVIKSEDENLKNSGLVVDWSSLVPFARFDHTTVHLRNHWVCCHFSSTIMSAKEFAARERKLETVVDYQVWGSFHSVQSWGHQATNVMVA